MNTTNYIAGDWVMSASADYQDRVVQIQDIDRHGTIHALGGGNELILNQGEYEPIPMTEEMIDTDWEMNSPVRNGKLKQFYPPYRFIPFSIRHYGEGNDFAATDGLGYRIAVLSYVHELQHLLFGLQINYEIKNNKLKIIL